jgi:hypothetical protein
MIKLVFTVHACKLCHKIAELQDSHLMPKELYKRARDESSKNPNALLFSAKGEYQTSKQAKKPLLCSDCEALFNKRGECWTLQHAAKTATEFPLRDILLSSPDQRQTLGGGVDCFYSAGIPSVNAEALAYFALSVIWRAALCDWKIGNVLIPQLQLGRYTEEFRTYLLGKSNVPEHVTILVIVSSVPEVDLTTNMPQTKHEGQYRCHHFDIPGISVMVDVGARIPTELRQMCLSRGWGKPLYYTDAAQTQNCLDYLKLHEYYLRQRTTTWICT